MSTRESIWVVQDFGVLKLAGIYPTKEAAQADIIAYHRDREIEQLAHHDRCIAKYRAQIAELDRAIVAGETPMLIALCADAVEQLETEEGWAQGAREHIAQDWMGWSETQITEWVLGEGPAYKKVPELSMSFGYDDDEDLDRDCVASEALIAALDR